MANDRAFYMAYGRALYMANSRALYMACAIKMNQEFYVYGYFLIFAVCK